MKIAIHQPNFMPWMGYFYKIAQCDTFVFFVDAEYTKKSFIRRVKIHKPHRPEEEKYLIVPLQKHSDFVNISELKLLSNSNWQHKIKAQIHQSYGKAPFYYQLESILDTFFSAELELSSFAKYTVDIITHIAGMLDINCNWRHTEDLDVKGHKADANIEIVKKIGGTKYISGNGARKYQTEDQYKNQGIDLTYSNFPSLFRSKNLPDHFMNKSVVSYLAWYEMEELSELIKVNY